MAARAAAAGFGLADRVEATAGSAAKAVSQAEAEAPVEREAARGSGELVEEAVGARAAAGSEGFWAAAATLAARAEAGAPV